MKRGLLKAPKRIALKFLGTGPAKFLTKGLAKIPVIGGLIDFAINLAMGEPIGRAAAKAVGSTAGAALGTLIPIPFAGTILGGYLGDIAGGMLYDSLTGGKKQNAAGGGQITRGGKPTSGPIKRTLKKTKKIKRTLKVQPTKVKPGASVGGEEKIKKIFPEVASGDNGKKINSLGYMKSSYDKSSSIPGFGGLFGIALKAQLGQKPSSLDYQNAATGLNAWMQRTYSSEIMRTGGGAFAEGGSVDVGMFSSGGDMTNMIAKSLEDTISIKINDIINDLMKQLGLKPYVVEKKDDVNEQTPGENLGPGGNASDAIGGARLFMGEGFPPLASAILAGNIQTESGWKGQRTPWVLNDGAGTNKGLISWNRERITTAEKFLGKPLEKANNGEQVKWIKQELKQYGLLDIFLNPKSTEAELKSASYKYIGWGELGDRWQQSSRIFAAIQKGEMGTFTSGGGGIGGGSYTFGGGGDAKRGSKLAGELGDFIKQKGGDNNVPSLKDIYNQQKLYSPSVKPIPITASENRKDYRRSEGKINIVIPANQASQINQNQYQNQNNKNMNMNSETSQAYHNQEGAVEEEFSNMKDKRNNMSNMKTTLNPISEHDTSQTESNKNKVYNYRKF
jgi:hypothetical protein